jgi:hypothetical protein
MSLVGKISSTVTKALTKKGRKTKSENAAISKAAKANNMSVSEFKKEAKKVIKKDAKPKKPVIKGMRSSERKEPKRSRKERRELQRLIRQQEKALKGEGRTPLGRRTTTTDAQGREVEGGLNTRLLSKELPPINISPEALRRGIESGMLYIDPVSGAVKSTGQYASGAGVTGRMMRGKGAGVAPTEREILEMGGFEIRKAGGPVKKKKKKKTAKRIGVGKALRGYGAVRKG